MNYLDLFSGIGGFHKGLEEASFQFDWTGHSEIDRYAKSIYQKHFPQSEDLGDVTNINVSELPRADKWIVTGGWPCQDNSIAGKRKGQSGSTRSGLLSQIIRILGEIIELGSEVVFIGENVKGLYSVNEGVDFLDSIRGLTYLDKDSPQLTLEIQLLNTRWFLPQNRERIYFVGYPRERSRQQVFPIGESGGEIRQEGNGENISGCLSTRSGSGQSNFDGSTTLIQAVQTVDRPEKSQNGKGIKEDGKPMFTLTSQDQHGIKIGTWRTHKDGEGFREIQGGDSPTIPARAREDGSGQPVVSMSVANCVTPDAYLTRGERKRDESGKAVLTSMCERRIRRLTPIECERLQGFPDNWTKYGKDGELISDTQRYKCIGNAVSVPVVKEVGRKINP